MVNLLFILIPKTTNKSSSEKDSEIFAKKKPKSKKNFNTEDIKTSVQPLKCGPQLKLVLPVELSK